MITIYTSPEYLAEKEYTCKVIFSEILGVDFSIIPQENIGSYTIEIDNNIRITCNDAFFSKYKESTYMQKNAIPEKVNFTYVEGIEEKIPVIYGTTEIDCSNSQNIQCGIDIIASAFFMLSRWEETVSEKKDSHNRFIESESLAVKYSFIDIPVVHVYAELFKIWTHSNTFSHKNIFSIIPTHDIDFALKWNSCFDFLKTVTGDIIKRKSIKAAVQNCKLFFAQKDPYDTFSVFFENEKNNNTIYYFLVTPENKKAFTKNKIHESIQYIINSSNSNIGIHSNYYMLENLEKNKFDIDFFSNLFSSKLNINRQHFLRFQIPETFEMLEKCGIIEDSSLYYRNYPGFRTGMCIPHSVFNCKTHSIMKIQESPLIFMDVSIINKTENEIQKLLDKLISITKKYNGNFIYLWHNSSFDYYEWNTYKKWYFYIQKK